MSNIIKGYISACGCHYSYCSSNIRLINEYNSLLEDTELSLEDLKKWRGKFNLIKKNYKVLKGKDMPLSFYDFIKDLYDLGVCLDNIGKSKGKYRFDKILLRFVLV